MSELCTGAHGGRCHRWLECGAAAQHPAQGDEGPDRQLRVQHHAQQLQGAENQSNSKVVSCNILHIYTFQIISFRCMTSFPIGTARAVSYGPQVGGAITEMWSALNSVLQAVSGRSSAPSVRGSKYKLGVSLGWDHFA